MIGEAQALAVYTSLAEHTLGTVRRATEHSHARVVDHTPADAAPAMAAWLGNDLEYRPQGGDDFGARRAHAAATELSRGAAAVVLVGTDCPSLDAAALGQAVRALDRAEVLLGPATDGGYYLLALRQVHAAMFDDISWSAADTLSRTLAAAARARLSVEAADDRRR